MSISKTGEVDVSKMNSRLANFAWLFYQAFRCLFAFRQSSVVANITLYTLKRAADGVEISAKSQGVQSGPMPIITKSLKNLADHHNRDVLKSMAGAGLKPSDIGEMLAAVFGSKPGEPCKVCGEVHGDDKPEHKIH